MTHDHDPLSDGGGPKRAAILTAARRLFLEHPFSKVTMDAVAVAAGVSKVTIYAHFSDKQTLFVDAIGAECSALFSKAERAVQTHGDLKSALVDLGVGFVSMITSDEVSALHAVLIAEGAQHPELPQLFYEAVVQRSTKVLSNLLAGEKARGRIACADPDVAAEQFLALVQGTFRYRRELGLGDGGADALEAYIASCVELFLYGVATKSGGGKRD